MANVFGEVLYEMYKVSIWYVDGYGLGDGLGDGRGNGNGEWEKRVTFKPLIPPLISSAAFSPWAPGGLLVVVGVDMVVIRYLGTLGRYR